MAFRCMDMNKVSIPVPFIELLRQIRDNQVQKGFHALFTSDSLISGMEDIEKPSALALIQMFKDFFDSITLSSWSSQTPVEENRIYVFETNVAESPPTETRNFYSQLRNILVERSLFTGCPGFSLNNAPALDIIRDFIRSSPISSKAYHEYILWDDGDLWDRTGWVSESNFYKGEDAKKKSDHWAWLGAGWMRRRFESRLNSGQKSFAPYISEIDAWAEDARKWLVKSTNEMTQYLDETKRRPAFSQPANSYIHSLCDFLPYHKSRFKNTTTEWLPTARLANRGGPRLWNGIVDSSLHMHLRHLLLDGWLTLWPCKLRSDQQTDSAAPPGDDPANGNPCDDRVVFQPGSLSLLYWAARWADKPHTESPEAFIDGYNWADTKYQWFGGNWR